MSAPVADFGTLHRAIVRATDPATGGIIVECPAIAPGLAYGPVTSLVPDLAAGERVLLACLGRSTSDTVVLVRCAPRWPTVAEIPALAEMLAALATGADLAALTERVDRAADLDERTRVEVGELVAAVAALRARTEEIPEALARTRAAAGESDQLRRDEIAALRRTLFGREQRSAPFRARARTTVINYSSSSGDAFAAGTWSAHRDPDGLILPAGRAGRGATGLARMVVPVAGSYRLQLLIVADAAAAGLQACAISAVEGDAAPAIANAVVLDATRTGGTENLYMNAHVMLDLTASTVVYWSLWGNINYVVRASKFTAFSEMSLTYQGPPSA